jgi:hypothetical protein
MIEQLDDFPANVVAFVCSGRVTRGDYEGVLVPAVETALRQSEKVSLYYQFAVDFSHVESGIGQNFGIGMEYLLRWDRIAIVTDVGWIRETVRALGFLIPGVVDIFALGDAAKAREWILATGQQ